MLTGVVQGSVMSESQRVYRFDRREMIEKILNAFVDEGRDLDMIEVHMSRVGPVDLDLLQDCLRRVKAGRRLAA